MAGSYGVPLNDPVFGISSGSIPCENPGQRPIPAPTPSPPAGSAGSAGVRDPYVQILESQSAMSMLMMQMAREMNQRSLQQQLPQQPQQQVGQDPNQPQAAGQQGGQTGGYQKEMKMDEKWIPAMPVPGWKSWTSRGKELSGFEDWLEKFSGWLSLTHDAYGPELRETIHADYPIQPCRSPEQLMRSKRLFHILKTVHGLQQNRKPYQISDFCNRNHRIQWIRTSSSDSKGVLFDVQDGSFELPRDVLEVPCEENRASFGHRPGS